MMQPTTPRADKRLAAYITATEKLRNGQFDIDLPASPRDDLARLGDNLMALAKALESSTREQEKLTTLTSALTSGFLLDEILDRVYVDFHDFIPYDRMGVSLIDLETQTVTAIWARSDHPRMRIRKGYTARLEGSSLQNVIRSGQPRIINDLEQYLRDHPDSYSTKLAISEGIRSSITCPLIAKGKPIGFIFFSSSRPDAYKDAHVALYQHISEQLSAIVEIGVITTENATQKAILIKQEAELERLSGLLAAIDTATQPPADGELSAADCRAVLEQIKALVADFRR